MSQSIETLLNYSEFAQAAYGYYSDTMTPEELSAAIRGTGSSFTDEQANLFLTQNSLSVLSSSGKLQNGFMATLFSSSNGLVLGISGTDDENEIDDDFQLHNGTVPSQFESLVNYIETLKNAGTISETNKIHITGHYTDQIEKTLQQ